VFGVFFVFVSPSLKRANQSDQKQANRKDFEEQVKQLELLELKAKVNQTFFRSFRWMEQIIAPSLGTAGFIAKVCIPLVTESSSVRTDTFRILELFE